MEEDKEQKQKDYLLPASIIVAAVLIAGSWIYTAGLKNSSSTSEKRNAQISESTGGVINMRPVSSDDHIRGNPNAPIKIVEYSDLECPFCKSFHPTLQQILANYGDKIAWVYRHFPLDQLHPKARISAEASECAYELGGNSGFWAYVDQYFKTTPSNNQIDLNDLPVIAEEIGLDKNKFEECLSSGKYASKVQADVKEAEAVGGRGTPYSILIAPDGKNYPIEGAQSYSYIKSLIDSVIGA